MKCTNMELENGGIPKGISSFQGSISRFYIVFFLRGCIIFLIIGMSLIEFVVRQDFCYMKPGVFRFALPVIQIRWGKAAG